MRAWHSGLAVLGSGVVPVARSLVLTLHYSRCSRAMVTLLAAAPEKAGAALAPELYSAHVDMHQRLLVGLRT